MSEQKTNAKAVSGCAASVWYLAVVLPLWYALMLGVLLTIDPPVWLWICFWTYAPVSFLGAMFKAVFDATTTDLKD